MDTEQEALRPVEETLVENPGLTAQVATGADARGWLRAFRAALYRHNVRGDELAVPMVFTGRLQQVWDEGFASEYGRLAHEFVRAARALDDDRAARRYLGAVAAEHGVFGGRVAKVDLRAPPLQGDHWQGGASIDSEARREGHDTVAWAALAERMAAPPVDDELPVFAGMPRPWGVIRGVPAEIPHPHDVLWNPLHGAARGAIGFRLRKGQRTAFGKRDVERAQHAVPGKGEPEVRSRSGGFVAMFADAVPSTWGDDVIDVWPSPLVALGDLPRTSADNALASETLLGQALRKGARLDVGETHRLLTAARDAWMVSDPADHVTARLCFELVAHQTNLGLLESPARDSPWKRLHVDMLVAARTYLRAQQHPAAFAVTARLDRLYAPNDWRRLPNAIDWSITATAGDNTDIAISTLKAMFAALVSDERGNGSAKYFDVLKDLHTRTDPVQERSEWQQQTALAFSGACLRHIRRWVNNPRPGAPQSWRDYQIGKALKDGWEMAHRASVLAEANNMDLAWLVAARRRKVELYAALPTRLHVDRRNEYERAARAILDADRIETAGLGFGLQFALADLGFAIAAGETDRASAALRAIDRRHADMRRYPRWQLQVLSVVAEHGANLDVPSGITEMQLPDLPPVERTKSIERQYAVVAQSRHEAIPQATRARHLVY